MLVPKLFILYINNICEVSNNWKMFLFADDTNIFCSGSYPYNLTKVINNELNKQKAQLDRSRLSLNLSKTRLIIFGNYRTNMKLEIQDTVGWG